MQKTVIALCAVGCAAFTRSAAPLVSSRRAPAASATTVEMVERVNYYNTLKQAEKLDQLARRVLRRRCIEFP